MTRVYLVHGFQGHSKNYWFPWLEEELRKMFPGMDVKVSILNENRALLKIKPSYMPIVIGKKGKRVAELENIFGLNIDVEPMERKVMEEEIDVEVEIKRKTIRLYVGDILAHRKVSVFAGEERLFDATVSGQGYINLRKTTANGKKVMNALKEGRRIHVEPL